MGFNYNGIEIEGAIVLSSDDLYKIWNTEIFRQKRLGKPDANTEKQRKAILENVINDYDDLSEKEKIVAVTKKQNELMSQWLKEDNEIKSKENVLWKYDKPWWAPSKGTDNDHTTFVDKKGEIRTEGFIGFYDDIICIRPALITKSLTSRGLVVGEEIEIKGYTFRVLADNILWMSKQDIGTCRFCDEWKPNDAANSEYKLSAIKKKVDEWFGEFMHMEG